MNLYQFDCYPLGCLVQALGFLKNLSNRSELPRYFRRGESSVISTLIGKSLALLGILHTATASFTLLCPMALHLYHMTTGTAGTSRVSA